MHDQVEITVVVHVFQGSAEARFVVPLLAPAAFVVRLDGHTHVEVDLVAQGYRSQVHVARVEIVCAEQRHREAGTLPVNSEALLTLGAPLALLAVFALRALPATPVCVVIGKLDPDGVLITTRLDVHIDVECRRRFRLGLRGQLARSAGVIDRLDPITGAAASPTQLLFNGNGLRNGFDGMGILPGGRFYATRGGGGAPGVNPPPEVYRIDPATGEVRREDIDFTGIQGRVNGLAVFVEPSGGPPPPPAAG